MNSALDIIGARQAERQATLNQQEAEQELIDSSRRLAEAERAYRVELAKAMTALHAGGIAWTACRDIALGDERVAELRFERDVAKGVKEAAEQAAYRLGADRRALGRLVDWSQRIDIRSGGVGEQPAALAGGAR
jgi:hypothetical protein